MEINVIIHTNSMKVSQDGNPNSSSSSLIVVDPFLMMDPTTRLVKDNEFLKLELSRPGQPECNSLPFRPHLNLPILYLRDLIWTYQSNANFMCETEIYSRRIDEIRVTLGLDLSW